MRYPVTTLSTGRGLALIIVLLLAPAGAGAQDPTPRDATRSARPLTIEESVALALEGNRTIQDARLQLLNAERQVSEARGGALPAISGNARFSRNLRPLETFLPARIFDPTAGENDYIPVRFAADNNWNSSITIDQPLFDYKVFIGLKVAGTARQLSVEGVRGAAQQAATTTRKAYYDILLAREHYRLTENSVQRLHETLEETRSRNRAGQVSDYDVLRLEVELGNLEPQLRQAADALEASRRNLALLMAVPVDTPFEPQGSLTGIDVVTRTAYDQASQDLLGLIGLPRAAERGYDALLEQALADRADLRQNAINVELGQAQIQASLSDFFPTLGAFYSYTITAQDNGRPDFFGEGPNQRTTGIQAGLSLTVPIFSGFQKNARLQQNRITVRRTRTAGAELQQQAANQVRLLLNALEETRLRADAQSRAVGQAQQGFAIASAQYREGLGSRLEVVDAENALRLAEFNYAQSVYDHLNAQADLDLAVGRVPLVDEVVGDGRDRG